VLFRVVLVMTPLLFFVGLEAGLRLSGFGHDLPLFVPVPGFENTLVQNRDVAQRYFGDQAGIPDAQADPFKRDKNPGAFRIFVQGGSSAAGFPYNYGVFSRMLEQRLLQSFDDREIEVVNTALAAVNSWTLLDFAPEILEQSPDAVLVYAGHNEFYGALGVASTRSFGHSRTLVRLRLRLRPLRTTQLIERILSGVARLRSAATPASPQATLMERMVAHREIPYGSDLFERGLQQFRANLEELLDLYADAGVAVFVATVASNERTHAPFAGQVVTDSLSADQWFALARDLDRAGRYQDARRAYVAARDRDALRFRAPSEINRIIRDVAAEKGATVVEVEAHLAAAAQDGIIGSDLMTEHLHPNIEGYFQIADAFYDALMRSDLFGPGGHFVAASVARGEVLVTEVDSLFGEYRVAHLESRWPFQAADTGQAWQPPEPQTPEQEIAHELYLQRISWYDAMIQLSNLYLSQGNPEGALQPLLAAAQQFDFHPDPFGRIGSLFLQVREYQEALRFLQASLDRGESAEAHYMVGTIYSVQDDLQHTIEHMERGRKLGPPSTQALYRLAEAYARVGRIHDAQVTLQELLRRSPEHEQGRRLLKSLS